MNSIFLIVSNPRSGSTWLHSTLNLLPGTCTNYEIAWRPSYTLHPFHREIGLGVTVKSILKNETDESLIGSKLVLDPHHLTDITGGFDLAKHIDSDIRIIHLHRSYFDNLLSATARGSFNISSQSISSENSNTNTDNKQHLKGSVVKTPVGELIRRLIILFINDLTIHHVTKRANQYLDVNYREIHERRFDISEFINAPASRYDIDQAFNSQVTQKLPSLDHSLLPHSEELQKISTILDRSLDLMRREGKELNDILNIPNNDIDLPELKDAIAALTGRKNALRQLIAFSIRKAVCPPVSGMMERVKRQIIGRRNGLIVDRFPNNLIP